MLQNRSEEVAGPVERHLDALLSVSDGIGRLARYLQTSSARRIKVPDLQNQKSLHVARWSAALQISHLRRRREGANVSATAVVQDLESRHSALASKPARRAGPVTTVIRGSQVRALPSGPRMMPSLRLAWESGLRDTYALDDGVPYSSPDRLPSLLLVDSWPDTPSDPEKPIRAAAFGGWVMASASDAEDAELLLERSQEFVREKVYGRSQD